MAEGFAVRGIPFEMHQGEFVPAPCCPLWGKCRDSGKGGGVGDFELLPFIEQHPLSQPCRFRSAVKSASSPIGEPSGLLRIRPGFHKGMSAYRETPLRLAKSRLTAVARLHGACASLSQPLRAASSPIGEPRGPLRIRPRFHKIARSYRNPSVRPLGPASSPFRGAK